MVVTQLNPIDLILLATFTGIGTAMGNRIFNWFEHHSKKFKDTFSKITKQNEKIIKLQNI